MTAPTTSKKPLWRRGWFRTLAILGLLLGGLLIALPFGIAYGIKRALVEAGADTATVDNVDLNLFTGTFAIDNLGIEVGADKPLILPRAYLDLDWSALFKDRYIVIEEVLVKDAEIMFTIDEQGRVYAAGIAPPEATEEPEPTPSKTVEVPFIQGYGLRKLQIDNVTVHYSDPKLNTRVLIEGLEIARVRSWDADRAATLRLRAKIDAAPLTLEADVKLFGETREVDAKLGLEGLVLATFAKLAQPAVAKLVGSVSVDTAFKGEIAPDHIDLTQQGRVTLADLDVALEDETRVREPELVWDGTLRMALALGAEAPLETLALDGTLNAGHLQVAAPAQAIDAATQGLGWSGKVNLEAVAGNPAGNLKTNGTLEARRIRLALGAQGVDLETHDLHWQGGFNQMAGDETPQLAGKGTARIGHTLVVDTAHGVVLADLGAGRVRDLDLQGLDQIRVAAVELEQLAALRPTTGAGSADEAEPATDAASGQQAPAEQQGDRPVAAIETLRVDQILFTDQKRLEIDAIELKALNGYAHILPNGTLYVLDRLSEESAAVEPGPDDAESPPASDQPAPPAKTETAPSDPSAAEAPLSIRIGRLASSGDSALEFLDESTQPDFHLILGIDKLELLDLDAAQPNQPSKLDLQAHAGKYAKLAVNGTVQPFAQPLSLDLKAVIEALDLAPLSSYTAKAIGYNLLSGQLSADSSMVIERGEMDGKNQIKLIKLKLTAADQEAAAEFNKGMSMPLDLALNMLRDRHDNIELDLPVTGNVDDPDVDISGVINKALGAALQTAGTSYLSTLLFPYGTALTVVQLVGEAASHVAIDPILYPPGQAEAPAEAKEYLGKVSDIMEQRPELALSLCAKYVPADGAALAQATAKGGKDKPAPAKPKGAAAGKLSEAQHQAVSDLARRRAELLKEALTKRFGVPAKRVLVCTPEPDKGEDAKPRVDLLF